LALALYETSKLIGTLTAVVVGPVTKVVGTPIITGQLLVVLLLGSQLANKTVASATSEIFLNIFGIFIV
jgi:hypothetical protein